MDKAVNITFEADELWLMQSVIRHEVPHRDDWRTPPADLDLNNQIAIAISLCAEHSLDEYTLELKASDLLIIDYNVRADMKDKNGKTAGKNILLKSFHARRDIRGEDFHGLPERSDEPPSPSLGEIRTALAGRDI